MKMEDVIFRAMARKITWWQAAEILEIPESVMLRRLAHYKRRGYNPNWQRGHTRCGPTQVRLDVAEKILALYQEKYLGLAPGLFEERLRDVHGVRVSGAWTAFAAKGNPDSKGFPHWPPYSASDRNVMVINTEAKVEKNPDADARIEIENLLFPTNA